MCVVHTVCYGDLKSSQRFSDCKMKPLISHPAYINRVRTYYIPPKSVLYPLDSNSHSSPKGCTLFTNLHNATLCFFQIMILDFFQRKSPFFRGGRAAASTCIHAPNQKNCTPTQTPVH